jgi:hypothetical protein
LYLFAFGLVHCSFKGIQAIKAEIMMSFVEIPLYQCGKLLNESRLINPYSAKYMYLKWTCPFFNLDKPIHHL